MQCFLTELAKNRQLRFAVFIRAQGLSNITIRKKRTLTGNKSIYKRRFLMYNDIMKIILASKSPRRKQILSEIGVDFEIIPAVSPETVDYSLEKSEIAKAIALHKAREIFENHKNDLVIGADTIVVINNEILQKPVDDNDELRMLDLLSDKTHTVYTGYAVLCEDKTIAGAEATKVTFNCLTEEVKKSYVKSGLGLDKAGGYGIQDGYDFVKSLDGSYYNVMGFPKEKITRILKDLKVI